VRPTARIRRRLTRAATGGRLGDTPRTLQDAARAGVGVVVGRPLMIGRLAGAVIAVLCATLFWAGLNAPLRDALEAIVPGWVEGADGEGGRPLAVAGILVAACALAAIAAGRVGAAGVAAWDARRIGRRALAVRLALAPGSVVFGLPLAAVAGAIAAGTDRDAGWLFAIGPPLALPGLLIAVSLLGLDAWVRTLLLVRLWPRRGPPAA
jgi:hypothetical protein